jgi:hypothetical protein
MKVARASAAALAVATSIACASASSDEESVAETGVAEGAVRTQVTWRGVGIIFANVAYRGHRVEMTESEIARARATLIGLKEEVAHLSDGALGIALDTVAEMGSFEDWDDDGRGKGGVVIGARTMASLRKDYAKHDAILIVWKGEGVIPFQLGGLTYGARLYQPGISMQPFDREPLRDVLVHELGHQLESYYGCGNLFDHCGDLGQSSCYGDSRYPNGSWSCCYRNIYRGEVPGACLTPSTLSWHGRPQYPTYWRLATGLGR